MPESDVFTERAKQRQPATDENWNSRDDNLLDEVFPEERLNHRATIHIDVAYAFRQ